MKLLLEAATDYGIFFTDRTGTVTDWGAGAERLFGYRPEEICGRSSFAVFTPEDRAAGIPVREQETALAEGQAEDERWHMRKDGSRFFASGRLVLLSRHGDASRAFVKILRDFTPLLKSQEEARLAQERLHLALAASEVAIWEYVPGTGERFWDERIRTFFNVGPNETITTDMFAGMIHEDDRARVLAATQAVIAPGGPIVYEQKYRILPRGGGLRWVVSRATCTRDECGNLTRMVGSMVDITARKAAQRELEERVRERTSALTEKTRQLESFCYTVAHDLRAPLRAIHGYADFLRLDFAGALGEDGLGHVGKIQEAAVRLDALIQDLLSYSRVEQAPLHTEVVDLPVAVQAAIDELEEDIRVKDARVEMLLPLPAVLGDRTALHLVFANLIGNALKFSKREVPPVVTVSAADNGGAVRIVVQDNGIGIDPGHFRKVFNMFERIHAEERGTGVGLAIVQKAVERMGGRVGVESEPGIGSRFWVELNKAPHR